MARSTFTNVTLKAFGRNEKGGHSDWIGPLTKAVMNLMGWQQIPECYKGGKLDCDLAARQIELTPNEEALVRHALTLDIQRMYSFVVVRREIEGTHGKGHQLDLCFKIDFADPIGARKLEEYMLVAGKSKLRVDYEPVAVQDNLAGMDESVDEPAEALSVDPGCILCNNGIGFEPDGRTHLTGEECVAPATLATARQTQGGTHAKKKGGRA
jgi:hypothetical protein